MLEWVISSAALTLIVIGLRLILKGKMSLRLQYALWAIVLLRLLVPVSFGSTGLSVQNVVDRSAAATPVTIDWEKYLGSPPVVTIDWEKGEVSPPVEYGSEHYPVFPTKEEYDKYSLEDLAEMYGYKILHVDTRSHDPSRSMERVAQPLTVNEILNIVWAAGAGLIALWLLATNLRFYFKLRKSRQLLDVDDAPLPVYVTDRIDTPCLFGFVRPKIYVTPEVAGEETTLRYSIEHETTHRRHGDHIWSILRGLCLAVHWYNPFVWIAAVMSRNDAELACDEATIKRIGEEHRADYGRTLIRLTCEKRAALFIAATTMTGSGRSIKERIKLIVKKPKTAIYTLIAVVLIVAIAVGCTFTGAKPDDPTEATETAEPTSGRAKLEASELPALLDTIDLQGATLTYYYGTDITFPAEATENAERYFGELKQLAWQDCSMGGFDADDFNGNYVRLTASQATVTIYQKGLSQQNLLHVETDDAEGWFQTGSLVIHEDGSQWYPYDNALAWYIEAQGASLYGGNTRILTAEEMDYFRELTASTYETYDEETGMTSMHMTEISCFFTSYYTNVRDIDAYSFLWYFPYASYGEEIDETEWQLVQRVLDWRTGEDQHLATREELMVPIHRIPRASVNEVLMKYAGVTVEEMNTDWFTEAIYVPETDCFYTYTSDAGHGTFVPWFGIEHGDQVSLWSRPSPPWRLDLEKDGDGWKILSHTTENYLPKAAFARTELPAGRAHLEVSDIPAILDAIDLREATLTMSGEEAAYPADAAICAEKYLEELKQYTWKPFPTPKRSDGSEIDYEEFGYRRLATPHTTITFCGKNRGTGWLVQIETEDAEGWFLSPTMGYDPWSGARAGEEMAFWYEEAEGAVLFGGEGRLLTAEELEYFRDYVMRHFLLTSHFEDVRDMSAWWFLHYFNGERFEPENEAERQISTRIKNVYGQYVDYTANPDNTVCRIARAEVDAYLTQYAGVTVEEMSTNWFEKVTYLPETDCFYIPVSYFGPTIFRPSFGVQNGSSVTLWRRGLGFTLQRSDAPFDRLTLEKNGDEWRVVSYISVDGYAYAGIEVGAKMTPQTAIERIFESGDASLTLSYDDGSQWKTYSLEAASDKTRLLGLADSFHWTQEDARYSPNGSFMLTAVSADGAQRLTFRPDGGAGMLRYYDGTDWMIWRATPTNNGYKSFIWSVRDIYDSDEAGEALYALSFRQDGSAEDVVEYFATTAFVKANQSLAPDSTRRMDELEITGWRVSQVSDDGDKPEISGSLWYAYTPRGPENITGPDHEGSGDYAGKIVGSLIFVLQKQEDGSWHFLYGLK